uniref:Uncharacterized protein n=1 Tax=Arundo donax TaxID=35708 RepID=A0A0A9DZ52_ARUDO
MMTAAGNIGRECGRCCRCRRGRRRRRRGPSPAAPRARRSTRRRPPSRALLPWCTSCLQSIQLTSSTPPLYPCMRVDIYQVCLVN